MKRLKENLTTQTYLTNRDHKICVEQRQILREYGQLATRSELSEWEADRLAEILELAEEDKVLSFLIGEIDISMELSANDLLTPEFLQSQLQGTDLSLVIGDPLTALKVSEGVAVAKHLLIQFAQSPNFTDKLAVAFGNDFDRGIAQGVGLKWAKDDFGDLPKIQVLSPQAMGGANGAYAISTNTVYLSKDFVDHSSLNAITSVTLEEIGHSVDARINSVDAARDEGDIFSRLVQNKTLDNAQLAALNVEDDHGLISVGGVQVQLAIKKAQENPYMSFLEGYFSDDLWGRPRMSCWVSDLFLDAFEHKLLVI